MAQDSHPAGPFLSFPNVTCTPRGTLATCSLGWDFSALRENGYYGFSICF